MGTRTHRSAGTAGDVALWGGSSAAAGMAANPRGAHQAEIHNSAKVLVLATRGDAPTKSCLNHRLERVSTIVFIDRAQSPFE